MLEVIIIEDLSFSILNAVALYVVDIINYKLYYKLNIVYCLIEIHHAIFYSHQSASTKRKISMWVYQHNR